MSSKPDMLLWLSDARGQYIPRDFANSFVDRSSAVKGVDGGTWETLESGPDHEWYWDAWQEVCDRAVITDENGHEYFIHQDGDCWLVPKGMEWDEHMETFDWPKEETGPEWEDDIADNH